VLVVAPSPRLGATRILAFGDSITAGEVPVPGEFAVYPRFVMPDLSYPADLTSRLQRRYTDQGASRVDAFSLSATEQGCDVRPPLPTGSAIVVVNAGCLGAHANDFYTYSRMSADIAAYHPDVVLLLIGVNDLDIEVGPSSIDVALAGVSTLIATARQSNARVLVGNLLPMIPGRVNSQNAVLVTGFNERLSTVVNANGVTLVDLYSDIVQDVNDWISDEGLHPTAAGYDELSRVWFDSIQRMFESQPTTPTAMSVGRR
jgi:lysophospholipase L1-like esterase